MIRTSVQLPKDILTRIDKAAQSQGISRSDVIRMAVIEHLKALSKKGMLAVWVLLLTITMIEGALIIGRNYYLL